MMITQKCRKEDIPPCSIVRCLHQTTLLYTQNVPTDSECAQAFPHHPHNWPAYYMNFTFIAFHRYYSYYTKKIAKTEIYCTGRKSVILYAWPRTSPHCSIWHLTEGSPWVRKKRFIPAHSQLTLNEHPKSEPIGMPSFSIRTIIGKVSCKGNP